MSKKNAPVAAKKSAPPAVPSPAKANGNSNGNSNGNGASSAPPSPKNSSAPQPSAPLPSAVKHEKGYTFDTTGFDKETVVEWYKMMHLGRKLDEKAANYLKLAKGWSYHAPCAGHEGIQLAIGKIFRQSKDYFYPYYRDFLSCIAAGITPDEIIMNGLSKAADVSSGGRNMSNHFAKYSLGVQNRSALTGNHSQMAAGTARAIKKYNGDELVIYSSGESACSEGYFYESVNGACREKLPVIYVIQNNGFGISVPVREQSANTRISDNFRGFGNLLIINIDGRDPFASYRALQEAQKYVLAGKGPAMVHADCDRLLSHSNSDNQELYRTKEEIAEMQPRDPVARMRATVLGKGYATEEQLVAMELQNREDIFAAADRVEPLPMPDPAENHLYLMPEPIIGYDYDDTFVSDPNAPQITFREGINHGLRTEFRRNPNTFMWGQARYFQRSQGLDDGIWQRPHFQRADCRGLHRRHGKWLLPLPRGYSRGGGGCRIC
jgi:2-oxoisovalerate dehydrogenase E1 component